MEFGLMVEPQVGGGYEDLLRLARWSEDRGLAAFARSDHYLNMGASAPTTDAFAATAGLARETERIDLTVLVSPITFRHPAVLAKSAATIAEMSGGRFCLGVGTGWMQSEHDAFGIDLPDMRERFERLFEALAYIRAAISGGGGFTGRHYRLDAVEVLPRPKRLPIVVGGTGKTKTPTMAGRFADEFNMIVSPPDLVADRVETMRSAAREAGRDPDDILVSVMGQAFVAADEEAYRALIADMAATRERTPEAMEHALAERGYPRGTPEQARAALEAFAAVGVGRFYVQRFDTLDAITDGSLDAQFGALGG